MSLLDRTLLKSLEVLELIGKTGIFDFYKAVDAVEREYVVMFLNQEYSSKLIDDTVRFIGDVNAIAKLNHPNLLKIYEAGELDGRHYIVTEYFEGKTLDEHIRKSVFHIKEALHIVSEVTKGLEHAGSAGMIHGGINPKSILVVDTEEGLNKKNDIKIYGFGMAHILDSTLIDDEEGLLWIFSYMAPEQSGMINRQIDIRSDLYSLGIVFYQLLTSQLPFMEEDIKSVLHQQIAKKPVPPSQIRPEVPAIIDQVVLKLLNKDPEERYQSPKGLLVDLNRIINGEDSFPLGTGDMLHKLKGSVNMIGRDNELNRLKELYTLAAEGRGSVCLISGEAGMGKTRLIDEFMHYVLQNDGECYYGKCSEQNKSPYKPFAAAVNELIYKMHHLKPALRNKRIKRIKKSVGNMAEIILRLAPVMKDVLTEVPKPAALSPEKENLRFLSVCAQFFLELGEVNKPTVIVLDDLHWSDEATLLLLEKVLESIGNYPLLVLGAYRHGEITEKHYINRIITVAGANRLPLAQLETGLLNIRQINKIVSELLHQDENSTLELSRYIIRKSMGQPYFSIEIVRQLVQEEALLFNDRGQCTLSWDIIEQLPVSSTIIDIILKRAEKLDGELAEFLSYCSVVGEEFQTGMLVRVTGRSLQDVIELIDKAVSMQFIDSTPEKTKFKFIHDNVRNAFYLRIPENERQSIHLLAAASLEDLGDDSQDMPLFQVAHHYSAAGDKHKMLQFLLPAAEKAKECFANEEAVKYYKILIDVLTESGLVGTDQWLRAKEGLMEVYLTTGNLDQVVEISAEMLPHMTTGASMAGVLGRLGTAYFKKGEWRICDEKISEGLTLLGEKVPRTKTGIRMALIKELMVHILHGIFPKLFLYKKGQPVKNEYLEIINYHFVVGWIYSLTNTEKFAWSVLRMLNMNEAKIGIDKEIARLQAAYGSMCMVIPLFGRAIKSFKQAEIKLKDHGDEWALAQCYQWWGWCHIWQGEYINGIEKFKKSRELFEKLGDPWEQTYSLVGLGNGYRFLSNYKLSSKYFTKCLHISEKIKNYNGIVTSLYNIGLNSCETGNLAQAEDLLSQSLTLSEEKNILQIKCSAMIHLGYLHLLRDDYDKAIEYLLAAEKLHLEQKLLKHYIIKLYIYLADAYIARARRDRNDRGIRDNDLKTILDVCNKALKSTRSWPNNYGSAMRVLGNYYTLAQKYNKAKKYLIKSIDYYLDIPIKIELARSYYDYGVLLSEMGKYEQANERWRQAYKLFQEGGFDHYQKKIAGVLGDEFVENRADVHRYDNASLRVQNQLSNLLLIKALESMGKSSDEGSDLQTVLEKIIEVFIQLSGAEQGFILLCTNEGEPLKIKASHCAVTHREFEPVLSQTVINKVVRSKESLIINDVLTSEFLKTERHVITIETGSIMCMPLISGEKMLGVIYLDNSLITGLFNKEKPDLLKVFSAYVATVVENAFLQRQLQGMANSKKIVPSMSDHEGGNIDYVKQFGVFYRLTSKEQEVLVMLLEGVDAQTMSERLYISMNTLRTHIKNIYKKINIRGQRELIGVFINYISKEKV